MLAFLVHTGFFPTCAGWRGNAASAWSRVRIVWPDRTQSSRTECVRGVKRCGNDEESIVTENFYIYIYIYMNIYINWQILRWLELSTEVLIFFLPLSNNFMPCLLFWEDLYVFLASVWQTPFTRLGGEEVVIISGRRAERIWRFLYWLQCSPSFLPPPCPL